jgi:uncharacterized protein (TIGR02646 family)
MRAIVKRHEPASLTEHRASAGADYENYRNKDELRACLVREQRGICCYCLSRIRSEYEATKIEHWHCQTRYPAEQLDYSNLLGACMGNEGKFRKDQHCDTRKGDRDLSRSPANPMHHVEDVIRFIGDGTIFSTDPVFDGEINDVLNLNLPFLRNNRKKALAAFQEVLGKHGQVSRNVLERWLSEWNGESGSGELQPFCQVVVYYLRKKLSRT